MNPNPVIRTAWLAGALALLAGCAEEAPPPTVQEFVDDPIRLEATVIRCSQDRQESRYEPACVNARQAISVIEAREERARRDAFEEQSERKREALRRTQEAAAEARRRAEEAERLRREAEYLAQFGVPLPDPEAETKEELEANVPGAVLPDAGADEAPLYGEPLPAGDASNAPAIRAEPPGDEAAIDQ